MAAQDVKRKLTTILAADVEGYSRLMAADEEATLRTFKTYREVIDVLIGRHQGRLVGGAGDSVLAEFGSAVEAVRCAISVQEDLAVRNAELTDDRRIRFRIGINIGDVMVDGDDLFGDGVNVAARLEGLAEPGGICVSGNVFEQVKRKLSLGFEDMGPQEVKNIPEPVSVYRVQIDESAATLTTPLARASASRRRIVVRAALAAAGVVVLLAGGVWLWSWYSGDKQSVPEAATQSTTPDKLRIAILPFVNVSPDPKDEYFADGLTEELISRLSRIGELRVIARTSIMKYKGTDKGIGEIGRELDVSTILEGSVRKADDQLRITAQLIDVASETHLWSEDYDRKLENIFRIQSDVAEQVAQALRITLTDQDQRRIARPGTTNVEAFELYLEALDLRNKADPPGAAKLLRKAVSLDPEYAEAYAALALLLNSLYWYVDMPAQEAFRQAIEAAERALALDDSLANAQLALARAKNTGTWDWEGAERAFQQAIALNPSLANAHRTYAHHFLVSAMRRDEDALAEITRALELDPLSSANWQSAGWVRHHRKEPDQAIANFQRSKAIAPDEPWNYIGIGQNLIFKGEHDAGIAEIQRGIAVAPKNHYLLGFLAWAYGATNRLDEAKKVVERMKAVAETKAIAPMAFAWAYTGMGDIDNAVAALEEAYQQRDFGAIFIRVPEFYEVLSPDPRYHAILRKMGLES